jgi:hypothetical protein
MAKVDLRARRPKTEKLPDGRLRATFSLKVLEHIGQDKAQIAADVFIAFGTEAEKFPGLRLIEQYLDGLEPNKDGSLPLVRVYEELPATTEIQVGGNTQITLEDGRTAIEAKFLQLTAGAYVPGTVGTTTAPGDASAFLQKAEQVNNGAVRTITRTYVYAGTLTQVDETKNAGKLLLRSIVAVKTEPATPTGYTPIVQDKKNVNGLTVYSYTFAKGAGRVSSDVAYKQNGKLKITTIRYLDTDDGETPAGTLVNDDHQTHDGYTIYTKGYAEIVGDGIVQNDVETKYKGKLRLYRIVRLGSAPDAPAASLTPTPGTVVATATDTRQEDGFTLYDYRWTEGYGRISLETETKEAGALVLSTVRYFATDDGSAPTGTVIREQTEKEDGVDLITKVYAAGSGEISRETRDHLNGLITYTTIRALGAPIAATGEFETTVQDADGYSIYTSRGIVVNSADLPDEVTTRNKGALVITRKRKINAAPTSLTGELILDTAEKGDGYTLYTRAWAVGSGLVTTETRDHLDGRITYTTKRAYGAPVAATGEFETTTEDDDGYTVYVSRGIVVNTADLPDEVETRDGTALTITTKRKIDTAPTGTGAEIYSSADTREGYTLYTKRFAAGSGEISRETDTRLSGMLQRVTIRHLTAVATATQPTTDPLTGGTITNESRVDQDGYRLWTVVWTKANTTSFIVDSVDKRNKGKLVLYRREKLGAAPAAPSPTIAGTVVETGSDERLEDGYTVYIKTWAEGVGTIEDSKSLRSGGKLVIYRQTALAVAPSAPSPTISGTVVLIADDSRDADGVTFYDRTWAEGLGVVRTVSRPTGMGLLETAVEAFAKLTDTLTEVLALSGIPAAGKLIDQSHEEEDGFARWGLTFVTELDGTVIVDEATQLTFQRHVPFVYPGRAKYYSQTVLMPPASSVTGTCHDVYLSPPEETKVLATHTISYQDSPNVGTLANTLWNPTDSATINAKYTTSNGENYFPRARVEGLRGYRADNAGGSGTTSGADWNSSIFGDRMPSGATWAIALSGGPPDPAGSTWTLHAEVEPAFYDIVNGVQWYRKTVITATPPAQTALPV